MMIGVEPAETAPTLTLPRKRERGPTCDAARDSLTNYRFPFYFALNRRSTRQNALPLPLAGEGRGGGVSAGVDPDKSSTASAGI
jgi:hypothetical protein